jgi:hypothetical protein
MHTALLALLLKGLLLALAAVFAALWSTSDMAATVHEWLKDLAPVVVSIAVLFVTWSFNGWQKRLAKQKLRHDLYDRRMAIYVVFRELLMALPDTKKSDADIKALLHNANIARFEAQFLFDNANLPAYLEQLCKQITEEVIGNSMVVEAVMKNEAALVNNPEAVREFLQRAARPGVAKLEIAERHFRELPEQFAELKLTDFWK